jgi:hypothetical protein
MNAPGPIPAQLTCRHTWSPWVDGGGVGFRRTGVTPAEYSPRSFSRSCQSCGLAQSLNLPAGTAPHPDTRCLRCHWPTGHPARSYDWPAAVNACGHEPFDTEFHHAPDDCALAVKCQECDGPHHWPLGSKA